MTANTPVPPPDAAPLAERLRGPLDPLATLLLDHAADGLAIADGQARLLRHNARLGAVLGEAHPGLRQGASLADLFAPEDQAGIEQAIAAASAGSPAPPAIARLIGMAGQDLFMEASLHVLRAVDGSMEGVVLRLTDRTAQRRLQSQLSQAQKLQAVGQLAAGIAHDFNNLLTAIRCAAEAIEGRAGIDGQTAEDAAEITSSADRGAALVRHLLAFGRQQDLRPVPIRLNDALALLSPLLARLLGRGISVRTELGVEAIAAVDPTQLDQVVINLAVNARDAMPRGGTLTLRCGQIVLYRPLLRGPEPIPAGHYAMLEVQDTGEGIDPDVLPRVFDPFFTTRRDRGGNGLGLSTVHGIVRQSNGFLGLDSTPGHGTRFRIYLPRATALPAPPTAAPAAPPRPGPVIGRRVVLVDDETVLRRLAARALEAEGWCVIGADGAEDALRVLDRDQAPPDLLITDVVMPGMDGPSLLATLRARWPGLPALFVSGYADAALRESIQAGGHALLAKPYRLADLTAGARAVMDGRPVGPGLANISER